MWMPLTWQPPPLPFDLDGLEWVYAVLVLGWGLLPVLLMVVATVAVIVWLARRRPQPASEAIEALKVRLARGEITVEEYERLRRLLSE